LKNYRYKKEIIFWFLLPVIILLVLFGILALYMNSENFRTNIKSILLTQLENNLGKRIEIGKVDSISFQSVKLTHFIIYENNSSEKDNILFQADKAEAKFNLFFSLFYWKEWVLNIQDITFHQAYVTITRESTGKFDFIKKLQLDLDAFQQNFVIQRINFQNSNLIYHDELVYNYKQNYLTTRVKNIDGYFDLSQLPEIVFDFQGVQKKDNALLSLQGQLSINHLEYSLDFHLENADVTHFQYYLDAADQFNILKGKFNLDLNLSFSPEFDSAEIQWKGSANFQQVDVKPQFLNQIAFHKLNGSLRFSKPEIIITKTNGLYYDKNVFLDGIVLVEPEIYFDLNIESENVDVIQLKNDLDLFLPNYTDFSLQGELDMDGIIKGNPEYFQIDIKASSSEIEIENISFKEINLFLSLQHEKLIIHTFESSDSESIFSLKGEVDWSDGSPLYNIFLKTENFDMQHSLFDKLSLPEDLAGNIDSNLEIKNNNQENSDFNIEGLFTINSLKAREFSLTEQLNGNLKAVLNNQDMVLYIEQCQFESNQDNGFLNGEISFDEFIGFNLDFNLQIPDLKEVANSFDSEIQPAGIASIEGTIQGNIEKLETEARFYLEEFSIQDYPLGELSGEFSYQNNAISIDTITLINQDTRLTGSGNILLNESAPPEIDLSYTLHTIAISPLINTITDDIPLFGQLSGSGHIQGIWPELNVQGIFNLEEVFYQEYLLGQGQINFILKPEKETLTENKDETLNALYDLIGQSYTLEINDFTLQNEEMNLVLRGEVKISKENPFSLEIDFSHQSINDIIEQLYPIDDSLKRFLPSKATGKASINGDFSEQKISLSAQLIPQQEQNNPPSNLELIITSNDKGFTISTFSLIQTEGNFKASGFIGSDQNLNIEFSTEQLDINMLANLVQIDETINGIMNIEGFLKGPLEKPQLSMTAGVKKGNFREFHFENLQSDIAWDSKTNEIKIRKLEIDLEENYQIQAKGNLPLSAFAFGEQGADIDTAYLEIPLDFQVNMDSANLDIVKLFWKEDFTELKGIIDLELFLSGTAGNPIVNGSVKINQGKIALDNIPVQIEELNTMIEVIDNKVEIPPIDFIAYENHFNFSGKFELVNLLPENIVIIIQNKEEKLVYNNILESKVDLLVEIRGSIFNPQINGELALSDGVLHLDRLLQFIEQENISYGNSTLLNNSQDYIDLNIKIMDPFNLRLPNAEIGVTGTINLNGSINNPSAQGNLILRKGYLIYFEKRFVISEGRVNINGFTINDIDINARAQTNVGKIQISINISGKLADPQIRLSSQPALSETEIISLLTFDRNIEGLSKGEIDQILSQEMFDIIFQSLQVNLFKRIERELANQLGLDFLRLSTEKIDTTDNHFFLFDGLQIENLTLEVGKSIKDELFITYSTPLDFQGESSISIDYQISPDFSLNTQFDTFSIKNEDYQFKFGLEINF